jgi:hypothetical protein
MLTLLTTTGNRPEAWKICQKLMARQTYKGQVRWLVVDDGEQEQKIEFKPQNGIWHLEIYRPEPFWRPGQNTQSRNLLAGLDVVKPHESLVIIEDDDFYAADWLETVEQELKKAELVGESCARYYNVKKKMGLEMINKAHSSLCSTAMRGEAIETFRRICRPGIQFIDCLLWEQHSSKHIFSGHRVVGIKGLPGRQGIGMGHDENFTGVRDNDAKLLTDWVGQEAASFYIEDQAKWCKQSEN